MLETIPDSEARSEPEVNILCVDDEKNILRALTRIFRHESFGVLTATSGKEGLEILKNSDKIGLIISDGSTSPPVKSSAGRCLNPPLLNMKIPPPRSL